MLLGFICTTAGAVYGLSTGYRPTRAFNRNYDFHALKRAIVFGVVGFMAHTALNDISPSYNNLNHKLRSGQIDQQAHPAP